MLVIKEFFSSHGEPIKLLEPLLYLPIQNLNQRLLVLSALTQSAFGENAGAGVFCPRAVGVKMNSREVKTGASGQHTQLKMMLTRPFSKLMKRTQCEHINKSNISSANYIHRAFLVNHTKTCPGHISPSNQIKGGPLWVVANLNCCNASIHLN